MKKASLLLSLLVFAFVTVSFAQDAVPPERATIQAAAVSSEQTTSHAPDSSPAAVTPAAATPSTTTVQNPAEKFNRGVVNIITAPIEIAKQIDLKWKQNAQESKPISTGVLKGLVKGLFYTACRAGSGIWDVVTFPLKKPSNYESLMKPEFVLDK